MDKDALLLYKMSKMKIMDSVKPRYGSVKEVTAWTFSKEVDEAPQDVWVVIHMYQDYIEECVQMNNVLSKVAHAYPHIKFLRGRADFLGLKSLVFCCVCVYFLVLLLLRKFGIFCFCATVNTQTP